MNIRKEGARLEKNLLIGNIIIKVKQSFTRRVEIIIIHQPLFIGNTIKVLPQPNNHSLMDSFHQKLESHWSLSIKISQSENGTSSTFWVYAQFPLYNSFYVRSKESDKKCWHNIFFSNMQAFKMKVIPFLIDKCFQHRVEFGLIP